LKMILERDVSLIKPKNYLYFKRFLDLVISIITLVCISPVFVIIALIVKLDSKGPVFFKQTRVGLNSKEFTIYKFRTMHITAPAYVPTNDLVSAADHLTRVGVFLRKSSIDEIPQLINIINNQMSLIGPRPVIPMEKDLIELRKRLGADQILPGVTGLAQISGRDELEYEKKAQLDAEYRAKMSFRFDLTILFMTFIKIIRHEQISH